MNGYELFHMSMRCIGIGFFVFLVALVILMLLGINNDPSQGDK